MDTPESPDSSGAATYSIGSATITIEYRDITTLDVDAIVSSDDAGVTMSGGVSAAIRERGGEEIYLEAQKSLAEANLQVGQVLITGAGRLKAKHILHAAVIERFGAAADADAVRKVVRRCLDLSAERGFMSIAFPALAIGSARLDPEQSASAIIVETCDYLQNHSTLQHVDLALDPASPTAGVERFQNKIAQYIRLTASARAVDRTVDDLARFQPPSAAVQLEHDAQRLTDVRRNLDAGMISGAAEDFAAQSAPEASTALHEALSKLDFKLAAAVAKSADDPANTRFNAERLRLQIERVRLELLQLEMQDTAERRTTDERRSSRAFLASQEKGLLDQLGAIEANVKPLVISLHGIRTRGAWQKDVTAPLNAAGFSHAPIDFGRFGLLRFVTPASRARRVDSFRDQYRMAGAKTAQGNPSLIAHSLGSYIASKAIAKYDLKFDRIVFCGAIVPTDYDWDAVIRGGFANQVLNDYGGLDVWSRLAEYVVSDAGRSGLVGFDKRAGGKVMNRLHKSFAHSDYFYADNYDNWVRFLRGQSPNPPANLDGRSTNWRFRLTLLGLAVLAVLVYLFFIR